MPMLFPARQDHDERPAMKPFDWTDTISHKGRHGPHVLRGYRLSFEIKSKLLGFCTSEVDDGHGHAKNLLLKQRHKQRVSRDENVIASAVEHGGRRARNAQLISRIVSSMAVRSDTLQVQISKVPSAPSFSAPERTVIRL